MCNYIHTHMMTMTTTTAYLLDHTQTTTTDFPLAKQATQRKLAVDLHTSTNSNTIKSFFLRCQHLAVRPTLWLQVDDQGHRAFFLSSLTQRDAVLLPGAMASHTKVPKGLTSRSSTTGLPRNGEHRAASIGMPKRHSFFFFLIFLRSMVSDQMSS